MPLPYEFHVTIEADQELDLDKFQTACGQLGVKPIVLDLGDSNTKLTDVMTSSTEMLDDDQSAFESLNRIGDGLAEDGFSVVRRKIETAPWHPASPQITGDQMPDGSYFEAHFAVSTPTDLIDDLRDHVTGASPELHLSRNMFKRAKDGRAIIMATLRDYDTVYSDFGAAVEDIAARLDDGTYLLAKNPITEFALYDSNTHHDDTWMNLN